MKKLFILFGFLSAVLIPATSFSTGLSKSVIIGPKAIGMGGAFVGIADDPTAIFHNPAGMTQMTGHAIYAGFDSLITDEDYTPPGGTTESANTELIPVPNFGYVNNMFEPIWVGLGVFFPHGNGGKFPTASAAPFNPLEGRIYSMEITPGVAWKILPNLSLGATLRIVRVSSSLKGQALPTGGTLDDLSVSGWGFGGSVGLLYKPLDYLSFGANYRSVVNINPSGSSTFTPGGTLDATMEGLDLPTLVTAGFGVSPLEKLTLGLSYAYERNSQFGSTNPVTGDKSLFVTVDTIPVPLEAPQNWSDSHTIHFGAEYLFLPALAGRVGFAQDINESIPDASLNRVVGDLNATEVSAGAAYQWRRYNFALTWNARFGDRTIPLTATNPSPGQIDAFVQSISFGLNVAL